jgi:hypothetical protein
MLLSWVSDTSLSGGCETFSRNPGCLFEDLSIYRYLIDDAVTGGACARSVLKMPTATLTDRTFLR